MAKLATSADTKGREQLRQRKPVSVFNPTPRESRAIQNPAAVEKLAAGETGRVLVTSNRVSCKEKGVDNAYTPQK